jgi:hypothetical protein
MAGGIQVTRNKQAAAVPAQTASQFARIDGHRIRYVLTGDAGAPLVTFVNGLTQNADLWTAYAQSSPAPAIGSSPTTCSARASPQSRCWEQDLADHARTLAGLLDHVQAERTHLRRHQLRRHDRARLCRTAWRAADELVVISSFAELTPQLELLSQALYDGLTQVGLPYMQSMLYR